MVDWTPVLIAFAAGLPATIAAIGAFLISWRNGQKSDDIKTAIDDNTSMTELGTAKATSTAKAAATAATSAAEGIDDLKLQLNGKLEVKISEIVKSHFEPLVEAFKRHDECDQKNMKEIRDALAQLRMNNERQEA